MAIRFVPESNLAGAPSAPLAVEPDAGGVQAKFREVYRSLIAQGYSPEQAAEVASQQSGYGDSVRSDLRKEWESRPTAAPPETQPPAPASEMAQFDVLPGDQPGTQRVWNPQAGTYETRRMPQVDPRAAEKAVAQQRTYDNIAENYAPGEADKWRSADERGTIHVPRTARMIANADAARQDEYLAMEGGIGARGRIQQRTERQSQSYHPQWAREAGLDPNDPEVLAMPRGDLIAAARAKRNEGKPTPQQRELQWRATVMMRAGNHAGALALPGVDDNMRSAILNHQNASLNAGRNGGPIQFGPNPLGVQAAAAAGDAKNGDTDVRLAAIQADMAKAREEMELRREEAQAAASRAESAAAERLAQYQGETERALAGMNSQQGISREEWAARERMNTATADAALQKQRAEEQAGESASRTGQQMAFQQASPGLHDIISGTPHTAAANEALTEIARRSDRFQYLPGGGFGEREATAMNQELLALAQRAQGMGMQTRLSDPEYRRELIKQWGYSSGWSGGRGGWFGDFWQPMPPDLR